MAQRLHSIPRSILTKKSATENQERMRTTIRHGLLMPGRADLYGDSGCRHSLPIAAMALLEMSR